MSVEIMHKLANRLEFRSRQISPVGQIADEALAVAGEDGKLRDAASACLGAAADVERRAAELVNLLRQRRDEASERALKRLESVTEEPRSAP